METTNPSSLQTSQPTAGTNAGSLVALAQGQHYPTGALYVVATPIGNLADITLRALHVLSLVDVIAAEDTRNTQQMLSAYGVQAKLMAVHEHNELQAAAQVIALLQSGQRIALVTDAGTPAISDPGARLVQTVVQAGYRAVPIPGASSVVTALSVSGASADEGAPMRFIGFLPSKAKARDEVLQRLQSTQDVIVLFEAPHRIAQTLAQMCEVLGEQRSITLGRELTKRFEEVATMPLAECEQWLAANTHREQGEYVLVLHPVAKTDAQSSESVVQAQQWMQQLIEHMPPTKAAAVVSKMTGAAKKELYNYALSLKGET